MAPLGNEPLPSYKKKKKKNKWGWGKSAETLVPLETICWKSQKTVTRLTLLQAFPAGSREKEGGGGGQCLRDFFGCSIQ